MWNSGKGGEQVTHLFLVERFTVGRPALIGHNAAFTLCDRRRLGWRLLRWTVLCRWRGVPTAMDHLRPYRVRASGRASGPVEAWSGYPLQFAGQRRFGWQDEMVTDLRDALAGLAVSPSDVLSGMYLSTDESRCDVENRLFTNPGASVFPKAVRSIRFERGLGPPPDPPAPVACVGGHLHYYRYCLGGMWQCWEPAVPLARWHRVTRPVAGDGSCRPVWLAMKLAAAAGQVEVLGSAPDDAMPFGVQIIVHATSLGPRRVVAVSESLVDGIIAAFHAGASAAARRQPRLRWRRACPALVRPRSRRSRPCARQDRSLPPPRS